MQRKRAWTSAWALSSVSVVLIPGSVVGADTPSIDPGVSPPIESIHREGADEPQQPPYPLPPWSGLRRDHAPLRAGTKMTQVNVDADGANIPGDAANEPSIAIDPTDPSKIVIAWRQFDTVFDNFRQAGRAYSHDGGASWTFPGPLEPGVFRSDPVMGVDAEGVFYYCSLRGDFTVHFFISPDGGVTWGPPIPAFGGDKQWLAIDRTGGVGHGNIYLSWSTAAGCCGTRIFTRSTDGGLSYMEPIMVPGNPIFGTLAVGPDGELYVVGMASAPLSPDVLRITRSTNAQNPDEAPVFEFDTEVELGGSVALFTQGSPNPGGLLGQIWVAVDHSDGASRGNVYMLASVDPPGPDPLDVMFARSTDGGETWSAPVRVNDDAGGFTSWQWFGTMSVAPNGRIDVFWNDTRNDPFVTFSELFYASSADGGATWSASRPVSPPFNHFLGYPQQNKLGDYYHAISDNSGVDLAFAATFNGEQDVYHLRLDVAPGDADGDGDVDLFDYAAFSACVSGPGVPAGTVCETFDLDSDGDVDLADFGAFQRVFTGACGVAIVEEPGDASACVGGQAMFEVVAEGNGLGYQWSHNGINIAGADGPSLVIDPVTPDSAGSYAVFVQGSCGAAQSDAAMLEVGPEPVVLTQPVDVNACVGDPVTFSIEAGGGVPPLAFQWRRGGEDLPGATGPTLTIEHINPADAGVYRCMVSDSCDASTLSQPADLHIPEVVFTAQPIGGTVCAGDVVFLFASATEFPAYQWFKDGVPVDGATQSFLTIPSASVSDTGVYAAQATGLCNTVVSDEAFVEVIDCADGR